jgi:hypothetical protein
MGQPVSSKTKDLKIPQPLRLKKSWVKVIKAICEKEGMKKQEYYELAIHKALVRSGYLI